MNPPTPPTTPPPAQPLLYLSTTTPEAIAMLYERLTGKPMSAEGRKYAEEKQGNKK